jgi:hypothetical protein
MEMREVNVPSDTTGASVNVVTERHVEESEEISKVLEDGAWQVQLRS